MEKSRLFFLSNAACCLRTALTLLLVCPTFAQSSGFGRFQRIAMGEWSVNGDSVSQRDPKGPAFLLTGERTANKYTISARVEVPKESQGEAGLAIHFSDPDNYVAFTIIHRRAGPYALLRIARKKPQLTFVADQAPVPNADAAWHDLKAEVDGRDIVGYLDGKPIVSYSFEGTPPPYNSHGKTWDPDPVSGWPGLITVNSSAEYSAFAVNPLPASAKLITPQIGRWNKQKHLLARQSYGDTMKQYTDWFTRADEIIDKSKAPESLRGLPFYVLTNFIATDDTLWNVGGEFAFNHALLITGVVRYYAFTGERRHLDAAIKTADWQIEHATPQDWAVPFLAPSFVEFQKDGTWKGMDWGYEPDKSAYIGFSLLELHAVTKDQLYLDAALRIAGSLRKLQGPDGNWPFRVNARTGEVQHGYTCSQLWYVWFFEKLADSTKDKSWLQSRDRAFQWLLDNPVKTNEWIGLYGDIQSGARSFDQWVALETAMYLIDRRAAHPDYLEKAEGILDWINRSLVVDYGFFPGVPGLVEQSQYRIVLTHHELRLAELYAKLWQATRNEDYKAKAIEIANSVTWNSMSDGKIRQGFWDHAKAVPLTLSFNDQFSRIMGAIPETAPRNENHLQQSSSFVEDIQYTEKEIRYRTVAASYDELTIASPPKSVQAGGKDLTCKDVNFTDPAEGWTYEKATGLLRIQHAANEVRIGLE